MLFGSGDYKALVLLSGPDLASSVAVVTISSGGVAAVVLIVFDSRGAVVAGRQVGNQSSVSISNTSLLIPIKAA